MTRWLAFLALLTSLFAFQINVVPAQTPALGDVDAQGWLTIAKGDRPIASQLTLLTFGLDPSLLDEKVMMQCYVSIFNTSPQNYGRVNRGLNNELEYPEMVAFYRPKVSKILTVVPTTLQLGVQFADIAVGRREPAPSIITLGEYDLARKAFPFVDVTGKKTTITFSNLGEERNANCLVATRLTFILQFEHPVSFSELSMSEDAAKAYLSSPGVGAPGKGRQISLGFDLEVLKDPPNISPHPTNRTLRQVFLTTRVKRIVAGDPRNDRLLGVVYSAT